jgi:hypothetical protein
MMWNVSQQGSRHNRLIGESSTIKPAEHLQVLAGVAAVVAALTANSTRQMRFRNDPLAWPEVGHFAANSQYLTAEFVAENNWELVGGGHPSPAKNLQISSANARCENAHMCFVAEQRPQVPFDKSYCARFRSFEQENLLTLRKI